MSRVRNRGRRRGFTLMEVLLVLAILVILGSVAVVSFSGVLWESKNKAARIKIDAMKSAITDFVISEGRHPQSLEELVQISAKSRRSYMDETQLKPDPWDRQYMYQPPDQEGPQARYRLWSLGADGQDGTDDDITNWQ